MRQVFQISRELLNMYRERSGDPAFWAEPLNALSNTSFLIAAAFALDFAIRRRSVRSITLALILLAGAIGCGSFLFHTVPTYHTMWFDIIPITLFQIFSLWLISRKLSFSMGMSAGIVVSVIGLSFALMPLDKPLNGSLFYAPSLVTMLAFGVLWARQSVEEPYLLGVASCVFALAITARSIDWIVPWPFGTHFLWHLLNGIVVYTVLRTWVIADSREHASNVWGNNEV